MNKLYHRQMGARLVRVEDVWTWALRIVFVLIVIFLFWAQNNLVLTKNFVFSSQDLPKTFTGYKIVHISDICNSGLSIVSQVKKCKPNIIVVSGGYYDTNGKYDRSIKTINKLSKIAPVYYVYGPNDAEDCLENSEGINITNDVVELDGLKMNAEDFIKEMYGKKLLKDAENGDEESIKYIEYLKEILEEQSNIKIGLVGFSRNTGENGRKEAINQAYNLLLKTNSEYTMGIVGSAWTINEISRSRLRLAFTGGTFGTKNISPIYTKGVYGINSVQVFISGGIGAYFVDGKETKIRRIFNFPEIQCITLSDGTIKQTNPLEKLLSLVWGDVGTVFDNDEEYKIRSYKGEELDKK